MALSKMGFSFDINTISAYKAECFNIIASEIGAENEREMEKVRKKHSAGSRR